MKARIALLFIAILGLMQPAAALAKDRLGIYNGWAAFKDAEVPRCYAIASPEQRVSGSVRAGYLSVGFWPGRGLTHQIYVSLSRNRSANSAVTITAGGRRFRLKGNETSGWAANRRSDLA
ncbi:MAG: hypothetical protein KAZ17_01210, partial [Sphingorhabdus sp.]|nr:hypothetical protein [Sphingorhabdus sp.]